MMNRRQFSCSVLLIALTAGARADFQAEVKFSNGASRTLKTVSVQDGKLMLASENLAVPLAQIQTALVSFDRLTLDDCKALADRGAYKELAVRTTAALTEAGQAVELPGNIDEFLLYHLRACLWTQQFEAAQKTVAVLQSKNSPVTGRSALYNTLILIEQKKDAEAAERFKQISDPDKISAAMSEYIRGRLASGRRDFEAALRHFAAVIVYCGGDREWMPSATFQEGAVYKRTGYLEAAANVADELIMTYPDSPWGQRAGELK